jgi:hypothetical protein
MDAIYGYASDMLQSLQPGYGREVRSVFKEKAVRAGILRDWRYMRTAIEA